MNNRNIFLEAVPKTMTDLEFFKQLIRIPKISKNLAMRERLEEAIAVKYQFFQPLTKHYELYEKIAAVIRASYKFRTPDKLIDLLKQAKNIDDKQMLFLMNEHARFEDTILGFAFLGIPGIGKTTTVKKILKLIPQVKHHKIWNITQVLYLRLSVPLDGKISTLTNNFFEALDEVLQTNYSEEYKSLSGPALIKQMRVLCTIHFIGSLLLDETQDLKGSSPGAIANNIRFLKGLSNDLGVPIIFIGTSEADKILFGNAQNATRHSAMGTVTWDIMEEDDEECQLLIESTFKISNLKKPQKLTSELRSIYYKKSLAIPRILNTVHYLALQYCIKWKTELITPDVIEAVSKDNLYVTEVMLLGKLNNESWILDAFPDMSLSSINTRETIEASKVETESSIKWAAIRHIAEKLYGNLSDHKLNNIIAQLKVSYPDGDIDNLTHQLEKLIISIDPKAKTSSKRTGPAQGVLVELCQNSKTPEARYQMLKEAGYIPVLSDLIQLQ
jgi:hypothetical protein